eukprot:m.81772 g.81772  ORF g.81772 m.81772 type:complete len:84 (-) comp8653_c0_seq1:245-496(-)
MANRHPKGVRKHLLPIFESPNASPYRSGRINAIPSQFGGESQTPSPATTTAHNMLASFDSETKEGGKQLDLVIGMSFVTLTRS